MADLTSNVLTFVLIGEEGIEATKLVVKIGGRGIVKEVSRDMAVETVKQHDMIVVSGCVGAVLANLNLCIRTLV